MTEEVVTTGAVGRAELQSNCHHQQTNIQLFKGRMPFLLPSQKYHSIKGNLKTTSADVKISTACPHKDLI